ncbi:MAG: hypothetical protein LCI00_32725 [Chloroflexi bacterium]|nr:hypothetical protein [Chloroflexota bacterium]
MTRPLLLASLMVTATFTVLLLLFQLQPYDMRPIHELLPDTCDEPCLLGIFPGSTTDEEALHALMNSAWVDAESVQFTRQPPSSSRYDDLARIQWSWSAARPDWVMADRQPYDGIVNIRNHVVERIAFDTRIEAADLYRHLGSPTILVFAPASLDKPWSIEWVYRYPRAQLVMHTEVRACPYQADLWRAQLYVQMEAKPSAISPTSLAPPSHVDMRMVFQARKKLVCGLS